jgi:methanogenic corrinoid protein MtbC1
MIDNIIASCRDLSKIQSDAADEYVRTTEELIGRVNDQLESHPKFKELIGYGHSDVMRDNHRNHAMFMATLFRINSFELLARTVPWVYRAYHARGFSYDYFPVELVAWQIAIHECFDKNIRKTEILAVYAWMIQHHEEMIQLSVSGEGLSFSVRSEANEMQEIFLSLLLHGDSQGCLKLADQSILSVEDLKYFYLDVVWPAMTRIGYLWESNRISVAEEHLSTAIVGRVMAALYPRFAQFNVTKGKAVVSAGPNDFHEVGARMVADFMEMDGWDVTYLGANIPAAEIVGLLKQHKPFVAALSVSTVFNLENARRIIHMLREEQETKDIKILVGGLAFNNMPNLWQDFGADGYAADADSALPITNTWWTSRNR